ncbi:YHYH protein [Aureliella helgolandensis]|uniref:YHYH domain-containing protein n=1 Tax=Aureliella helgolandensis TaxID=2527968 RepID=A0A518GB29_9BACT|nr:YHYH protein [Aureliella helgolandensis]QDV25773.1 hypothetical protein Q31a_41000 [Aureliella helgolandensis]
MKKKSLVATCTIAVVSGISLFAIAQLPPPPRMHSVTQRGVLELLPATSTPEIKNEVTIEVIGDDRVIRSNGIPNHKTGTFPNRGNPNRISAQKHEYRVPARPEVADRITPMHGEFGVAVNGVPFDPGAAEFFAGEPGWQYEPLSGAIALGIDVSHAHVQPTGKYHYHGLPTGLIDSIRVESGKHSPLVGWAADGFPIYAVYGYSKPDDASSRVQKLTSSYQLKEGNRPGGDAPGGKYDGTFVRDYEFVAGSGDLDECNGRQCFTPEFPEGTYAYFMTEQWPVVPRNYRGTPSNDFRHGPRPGGTGGQMAAGPQGQGGPGGWARPSGRGGPGLGPGGPPRPGEVLPWFVQESLNLSESQTEQLAALQTLVDERLQSILTKDQLRQLQRGELPGIRGNRAGGRPQ